MFWLVPLLVFSALAVLALAFYLRRSAQEGDRVLVAHGLILLVGLMLSGVGVAALKYSLL